MSARSHDPEAAVCVASQEALAEESEQRLTNRRPRNSEACSQGFFPEADTERDVALQHK